MDIILVLMAIVGFMPVLLFGVMTIARIFFGGASYLAKIHRFGFLENKDNTLVGERTPGALALRRTPRALALRRTPRALALRRGIDVQIWFCSERCLFLIFTNLHSFLWQQKRKWLAFWLVSWSVQKKCIREFSRLQAQLI